jgi:hypothetical protein
MRSAIVHATDRDQWLACMQNAGAADVYYLPAYHRLYEFQGVQCLAYAASVGGEALFHPFLLRPIARIGRIDAPPGLSDIETVYGYSGPVATTTSPDFLAEAWRGFEGWCREQNVVCEFIRFSPLLRSERFAAPQTEVKLDRETVEIRLEGGEDALWQGYESAQRNRVRKAIRRGLTCHETSLADGLATFRDLYEGTMRRAGATDFYFFPDSYYRDLRRTLSDDTKLFVVKYGRDPIAAGLFFANGPTLHYHLGASREDALPLAPNNLMFHQVSLWGQERGFDRLHLGGGRTNAADDALLRFKKRFSPHVLAFHIGKRIQQPDRYALLCDLWQEQAGRPAPAGYFRPYRLDPSAYRAAQAQAECGAPSATD